ncbi:MAG: tRNA(Met) cytidine acetyltransferase TmcA domain-containing protein, partial [Pontibacterium sp.]
MITGQADECRSLAQLAIRQCKTGGVWIGSKDNIDEEMLGCEYLSAGKTTSALGQELQYAVIDGFSGFNPNDFACISGAVVAGGLVFLLMPPLAKWYEFNDPQFAHLVAPPQQLSDVHSRFLPWVRKVLQHSQAWWFEVSADDAKQSQELIASLELYATQYAQSAQPLCSQNDIQPNTQQAQCLDSIRSQLKRTKRPSVVVAPRGRGKSALLGWLAAQQIQAGRCVLITAPDIGGVSSIYKHASIALGIKEAEARSKLEFLLPYEATQHSPSDGTVLLVDEAAGIALPVLQQLYHTYGRCVFATTTQGYEGTGQGFNLRFLPFLRKEAQRLIEAELVEPVRWGQGDRLEQLCHKALLMEPLQIDNGLTEDNTDQSSANALDITCIDRDNLLEGMLA